MRAQALAQLREIFPSVPPSAIADALGKAGGSVQQAADLLFKATQERPARTVKCSEGLVSTALVAMWRRTIPHTTRSVQRARSHAIR